MKKLFLVAIMAVLTLTANAQSRACQEIGSWSIKPNVGFSLSSLFKDNKNAYSTMRPGVAIGAEGQYMFNKWFALSAGLQYQQQGTKDTSTGVDFTLKMDYLNIPVLANFYVCKGLALKVGLQPDFLLHKSITGSVSGSSVTANDLDAFRSFDLQVPVGISYEINQLVLECRINAGTIGVYKDIPSGSDKNYTNGNMVFSLGYRF